MSSGNGPSFRHRLDTPHNLGAILDLIPAYLDTYMCVGIYMDMGVYPPLSIYVYTYMYILYILGY